MEKLEKAIKSLESQKNTRMVILEEMMFSGASNKDLQEQLKKCKQIIKELIKAEKLYEDLQKYKD